MSTSTYADATSYVSLKNKSGDFITLGTYNGKSMEVPRSSLLKLTVAPANQKYFSIAPGFERRLDNFRIPAISLSPVILDKSSGCDKMSMMSSSPNTNTACALATSNTSDYYSIGGSAYGMNTN